MIKTNIPSINQVVDGFMFQEQESGVAKNVDHKKLEIACVDLISKLENLLAKAKQLEQDDFIDESGVVGQKMIESLTHFSNECLEGNAAVQAQEEISRASTYVATYEEFLKSRPLTKSLLRTFWDVPETKDILNAHSELGRALVRACAATLYHGVVMVGLDSEFGKEIDRSTVVFVEELLESWA